MAYIGLDLIKEVVEQPSGHVLITLEVLTESGDAPIDRKILISKEVLESVQTEGMSEEVSLKDKRCEIVAEDIMRVFLKHNINVHPQAGDMNKISSLLLNMMNNSIDDAETIKWGSHPYERDIISIHQELLKKS